MREGLLAGVAEEGGGDGWGGRQGNMECRAGSRNLCLDRTRERNTVLGVDLGTREVYKRGLPAARAVRAGEDDGSRCVPACIVWHEPLYALRRDTQGGVPSVCAQRMERNRHVVDEAQWCCRLRTAVRR